MLFTAHQNNDGGNSKGSLPMLRKILALAVLLLASSITIAKDASADEQAIRALDTAWSHAAETKDLDKTVSFYADDASILPPNMPIATGKNAIRAVWSQFLSMPGFSITFAPSKVVIAKSGDMAYEIGTFQTTVNDTQGKPTSSVGKFVVNWQKRGGQWKVVADIFNDDK
jgi:uncharacterized protein (TIGR02246 family)